MELRINYGIEIEIYGREMLKWNLACAILLLNDEGVMKCHLRHKFPIVKKVGIYLKFQFIFLKAVSIISS